MTLARPYAKAAFELARSDGDLVGWDDMLSAVALVISDDNMARWLQSPRATADNVVEIVVEAIGGDISPRFLGFLGVLAGNDRLLLSAEISRLFMRLRQDVEKSLAVRVVSAVALEDSQIERLRTALARRFERAITLSNDIDPRVLGGAIIYAGDQVIDGSITGRLKRLETSLN
jgi:F-type H+-transporting ATPase subunit delta